MRPITALTVGVGLALATPLAAQKNRYYAVGQVYVQVGGSGIQHVQGMTGGDDSVSAETQNE